MTESLSKTDLELIEDEVQRFQSAHERLVQEIGKKSAELATNQSDARRLTSEIVTAQRDEDKQALQSDEMVAHGLARLRREQTSSLDDLVEQPYFARVVYHENNRDVEFKLGVASFPELRIIDWRKGPISKLYYDYGEGDEYDDEIAGRERQGYIKLKRAFRGRRETLSAIELKDVSYVQSRGEWHKQKKHAKEPFSLKDKESIKELMKHFDPKELEVAETKSGYLNEVLSLLTPEQFRLISTEVDKPVIIQGSAGTGKTTVALHRLAWLLFEENSEATERDSLVIMFNNSLASYVRHVLPELGIHHVKIVTFFEWALDVLHTSLDRSLKFGKKHIPRAAARLKSNRKVFEAWCAFLKKQEVKDSSQISLMLFEFFHSQEALQHIRHKAFLQEAVGHFQKQKNAGYIDSFDLAYLLEAVFTLNHSYRSQKFPASLEYLVIDEAQDFNIPELTVMLHALRNPKHLMLAGDLGQRIVDNRDFGSWQELLVGLGFKGVEVLNLSIAYRSTYQIYELAETVRDPKIRNEDLQFHPKFGPEPVLTQCPEFLDAVDFCQSWIEDITRIQQQTTAAIVCRKHSEARAVFDALLKKGARGVRLGDDRHFEFSPGVTVTDVSQVKGLEFKNVLIFNPSEKNYNTQARERNLLYVAISRAELRLDFVAYEPVSKLIPSFVTVNDLCVPTKEQDVPLASDRDLDLSRFEKDDIDA